MYRMNDATDLGLSNIKSVETNLIHQKYLMDYQMRLGSPRFDYKTFIASSIFFFAVLVNPRDFPIPNVPFLYLAFLIFLLMIGKHKIMKGFQRTRFLCLLLITYWFYIYALNFIMGIPVGLGRLAYVIEPLMIFCAAGIVSMRPGGTKAAVWALVSVVAFSSACGIGIYFVGEPFSSLYSVLQSSVGRGDQIVFIASAQSIYNAGLASSVFVFSYQLAVATLIALIGVLFLRTSSMRIRMLLWVIVGVLSIGIVTNAERASVLSISMGFMTYFFIKRTKKINARVIVASLILVIGVGALVIYAQRWEDKFTLHGREMKAAELHLRGIIMPLFAASTVFFEPWGAGGMSDHYTELARKAEWVLHDKYTPVAPHNHFASVIMYSGIIGAVLVMLLFHGMWKKLRVIRLLQYNDEDKLLCSACIALIFHSLTHNAGFFIGGYETNLVFGLLWGATSGYSESHAV